VDGRGYHPAERRIFIKAWFDHTLEVIMDRPTAEARGVASLTAGDRTSSNSAEGSSPTAEAGDAKRRTRVALRGPGEPGTDAEEGEAADAEHKPASAGKRRWAKKPRRGTIRANSIPLSNVLVDGRPAGRTPASIKVPVGSHTVMFVHPELGRKKVKVKVKANREAVAAVRFKTEEP
jgi:hypothetical protein